MLAPGEPAGDLAVADANKPKDRAVFGKRAELGGKAGPSAWSPTFFCLCRAFSSGIHWPLNSWSLHGWNYTTDLELAPGRFPANSREHGAIELHHNRTRNGCHQSASPDQKADLDDGTGTPRAWLRPVAGG